MPQYRLKINGGTVSVDAPERTPLLFVLRNDLGLKAAKLGCGSGNCGACTVLADGKPVNACSIKVDDVADAQLETCEGSTDDAVIRAFLDLQAAQCGYCIPGILMAVRGHLRARPRPSWDEILSYLAERHICRCGTHSRILAAIRQAEATA